MRRADFDATLGTFRYMRTPKISTSLFPGRAITVQSANSVCIKREGVHRYKACAVMPTVGFS